MFSVTNAIKPNKILSNLDKLNETIVTENLLRQNDPNQLDKNEKPLIKIPLFKDLYNFLARYRKKTKLNGKTIFHQGDLHTWCFEHEDLPSTTQMDQTFVVKFQMFYPDETYDKVVDNYEEGDRFRFFVTTRRLLEFSSNFKCVLQTDGTYKLLWIGNSVLLIGSSDFNRSKLHLFL